MANYLLETLEREAMKRHIPMFIGRFNSVYTTELGVRFTINYLKERGCELMFAHERKKLDANACAGMKTDDGKSIAIYLEENK